MIEEYLSIAGPVEAEIEDRRSRFLAHLEPVSDEAAARAVIESVRKQHHTAGHHCSAFILGPDGAVERSSDDGEPAGTAGTPILKAITARQTSPGRTELSDVTVAVVRYFGGIKLGAGGLVQAYSEAAAAVLDNARLVGRQRMRLIGLALPIAEAARTESRLRAQGCRVESVDYQADEVQLRIAVADEPEDLRAAMTSLAAITAGGAKPAIGEQIWRDLD